MKRLTPIRKNDAIADAQARYVPEDLAQYIPVEVGKLENPQTAIPRIAEDETLVRLIEAAVKRIPTFHRVCPGDARVTSSIRPESIHLVATSPPYWLSRNHTSKNIWLKSSIGS